MKHLAAWLILPCLVVGLLGLAALPAAGQSCQQVSLPRVVNLGVPRIKHVGVSHVGVNHVGVGYNNHVVNHDHHVATVAVPVVVPAVVFQFLPAVAPAPVPVAQPVAAAAQYNPAQLDLLIKARVDAVLGVKAPPGGRGLLAAPGDASDIPVARVPAQAASQAQAAPRGGDESDEGGAVAILRERCASCHTGPTSKGGFPIFSPDGNLVSLSRAQRSLISTLSDTAEMPPAAGGDPKSPSALSDAENQSLKVWASRR